MPCKYCGHVTCPTLLSLAHGFSETHQVFDQWCQLCADCTAVSVNPEVGDCLQYRQTFTGVDDCFMHPLVHLHVKPFLAMSILWSWHACFCSNAFASLRTLLWVFYGWAILGFAALSSSWDDAAGWSGFFTWAWMTGNPLSLVFSAY